MAEPTEREVRLLSQFSAALRKHISPPDRWEARIETFGSNEDDRLVSRAILVRFSRRIGPRVLQWEQMLSFDILELSVLGIEGMARYVAGQWLQNAAEATDHEAQRQSK